jgi:hypothetical protein
MIVLFFCRRFRKNHSNHFRKQEGDVARKISGPSWPGCFILYTTTVDQKPQPWQQKCGGNQIRVN